MNNPFLIAIAAWFFPGAGHMMQGRINRGIIVGAAIWIMFLVAILSGGAYFPGFDFRDGQLLYLLNVFAKAGNGLGLVLSYLFSIEPNPDVAARATFEYGGKFLETAGLLNYLAVIDAMDIHLRRKK
jgi:TM2 domain-containing membrane protein YozV